MQNSFHVWHISFSFCFSGYRDKPERGPTIPRLELYFDDDYNDDDVDDDDDDDVDDDLEPRPPILHLRRLTASSKPSRVTSSLTQSRVTPTVTQPPVTSSRWRPSSWTVLEDIPEIKSQESLETRSTKVNG